MADQMTLAIYVTASWMKIWNIYYNSIFNTSISIYIYFSSKAYRYPRNSNLIMMLNHETWVQKMTTTK